MNFYSFHIGDYASATRHLTWDEDLAYRRLLDVYYTREEPIPLDMRQVYRLACAFTEEHRAAVQTVLSEFFTESFEGWVHARCESEIAAARGKREKAAQSANARWSKALAVQSQSEGNANASENTCERIENQCEGNAPNPNPNPNPSKTNIYPPEFEEAWSEYPKRPNMNKRDALKAWTSRIRAGADVEQIIQGVKRYARFCQATGKVGTEYVKAPATFFGPGEHYLTGWEVGSAPQQVNGYTTAYDAKAARVRELIGEGGGNDQRIIDIN